jgi:hypothetical protein
MEHLNVLPDWDMFQTDHGFSWYHAAARCLSGGPIYVTDVPGEHDVTLIEQMTARTIDGRLIILRPERIGKTSELYVGQSEPRLLKVQTSHQGASLLGVFNVGTQSLREFITISDFADTSPTTAYVIHRHRHGALMGSTTDQNEPFASEVQIAKGDFEILTAHPIHVFGKSQVAVLGLIDKLTGAAAITKLSYRSYTTPLGIRIQVSLKGLGRLGEFLQRVLANFLAQKV